MTKIDRLKVSKYWRETAESDWHVFLKLKKLKIYPQSLFFLHLTLEKRLKELIVLETNEHAAFSHNLVHLIGKLDIPVTEDLLQKLGTISSFNLDARYPDQKLEFYKAVNLAMVKHWEAVTKEILKWLETHRENLISKK